ncbi:transmembrane protein, putative [Bodo saltans]|uniref:Transmembrane protein, putative n=1 Tax=Bodo saltans TaxID=75058 RepID=A0A0S4JHS4_BODSA|nr:transmembrane protein, putative [Bodo saltans]|eukprot:CUG89475.1 transmembrane protein, putative [Bodo saltans]
MTCRFIAYIINIIPLKEHNPTFCIFFPCHSSHVLPEGYFYFRSLLLLLCELATFTLCVVVFFFFLMNCLPILLIPSPHVRTKELHSPFHIKDCRKPMGQACSQLVDESSVTKASQHTSLTSSSPHDAPIPIIPTTTTPRVPTTHRGASVAQRWSVRDYQRLQQQQADADARLDQWRQLRQKRRITMDSTMGSTQHQETIAQVEGHDYRSDNAEVSYSASELHSVENSASDFQEMQRRLDQPVGGFLALQPTGSLGTEVSHETSLGCGDSAAYSCDEELVVLSDSSPRQRSHYSTRRLHMNSQGVNPFKAVKPRREV